MDLSFLDKSSQVTPLLVRLYDSHKLYGLAKDKKPLARAELTSAVSELLEMNLSPRESELIADVLIELMRQAEMDLRQALAERLSIMPGIPLRLVLQIANDEINIASSVLKNSPVLGDLDLIYLIKAKGPDYWRVIAARKTLSEQVMNILADTGDLETAMELAKNNGIKLTQHTMTVLSDIAQDHETLAVPLLRRDEVTNEIAAKLYKFVGQELKKYILENYEIDTGAVVKTIDEIVLELIDTPTATEFTPTGSLVKAAERYNEKGLLTVQMMLGTLRRGQISSFIAQFSRFTGLDTKTVEEILTQPNGQGLAVACKAYNIAKPDFVSIYLLTSRVRTRGKMVDVQDMTKAVEYFNRIRPEVAKSIMKNSLEKPT